MNDPNIDAFVKRARRVAPKESELEAIAGGVSAKLAGATATSLASTSILSRPALRVLIGGGGVVAVVLALMTAGRDAETPPPRSATGSPSIPSTPPQTTSSPPGESPRAGALQPEVPAPTTPEAEAPTAPEVEAPAPSPRGERVSPAHRSAVDPSARPSAVPGVSPEVNIPTNPELSAREAALLARARAAVERDAALALDLTAAHEREFSAGLFAQEREVIAIDALLHLGRSEAAQSRAARFVSTYPSSPHRHRVDALMRRAPAPTD